MTHRGFHHALSEAVTLRVGHHARFHIVPLRLPGTAERLYWAAIRC
jgi:hypothetical protein